MENITHFTKVKLRCESGVMGVVTGIIKRPGATTYMVNTIEGEREFYYEELIIL